MSANPYRRAADYIRQNGWHQLLEGLLSISGKPPGVSPGRTEEEVITLLDQAAEKHDAETEETA